MENSLSVKTIIAIAQSARKTCNGFFSDKKGHGDYHVCFGIQFSGMKVAFCPINVRRMPFMDSRPLQQSPQYESLHEHRPARPYPKPSSEDDPSIKDDWANVNQIGSAD
jgi:hypothetical protein